MQEGADQPDVLPANAEDRKAAAALSSLDAKTEDDAPKKDIDLKALNDAIKNLDASGAQTSAGEAKKIAEAPKKLVKVDQADVAMLVGDSLTVLIRDGANVG